MYTNIIEKIRKFNQYANNPVNRTDSAQFGPTQYQKCIGLVQEEYKEWQEAVREANDHEIVDSLVDLVVVSLGMLLHLMPVVYKYSDTKSATLEPPDHAVEACCNKVCAANMSKFDQTEAEAQATQTYYQDQFQISTYLEQHPIHRHWIVKRRGDGKILKSCKWAPPNWDAILKPLGTLRAHLKL